MASAVTLADAGVEVTVYEAGPILGGRARRVPVRGTALDNGLHILLGAYVATLELVRRVHPSPESALTRLPLDWHMHGAFRLKAAPLPAPLHLAAAVLTARGAPWRERMAAARFMRAMRAREFRLELDTTVDDLLAACEQGPAFRRFFWEPLCVAALNTPADRASARVFLSVLRDGLAAARGATDVLLARTDLSALFPEPAAEYVRARGGRVLTGARVSAISRREGAICVVERETETPYDHVVCAVSPHRAAALLHRLPEAADAAEAISAFRYQPIYSVYLQLEAPFRLPSTMLGLTGTGHWLFDRDAICGQTGLIAAVISAEGEHESLTQDELARRVYAEVAREFPQLPPLAWHRVIAEKRATFESAVDLRKPSTRTALPDLHLAGDYTASEYPATIEAAVRSGVAAARQALASRRSSKG